MPPPPPPFPNGVPDGAVAPQKSKTKWWLIGCGGCLTLIILSLIAFGAIFFGVFQAIKSSDTYKTALNAATSSPEVQEALGTPIEAGFLVEGSIDTNTTDGITTETSNLTIPLSGPKASAKFHFAAKRIGQLWNIDDITVTVDGTQQKIYLDALQIENARRN